MPTTNFTIPNPSICLGGEWILLTGGFAGYYSAVPGSQADLVMVGSAGTFTPYGGSWTVTVDGIATNYSGIVGTPTSIFSGLSDGPHRVTVLTTAGGPNLATPAFSVTGSAPAVQPPTDIAPQVLLSAMGNAVLWGGQWIKRTDLYVDGLFTTLRSWNDISFRFRATATTLRMWTQLNGVIGRLAIDGVDQPAPFTITNSSGSPFGWYTFGAGLDGAAEHEYALSFTGIAFSGFATGAPLVFSLCALNGTSAGSINSSYSYPTIAVLGVMGDSIASAYLLTPDSAAGFAHQVATRLRVTLFNAGIPGSTVGAGSDPQKSRTSDLAGVLNAAPETWIVNEGGTNDLANPVATFAADYASMLTAQRAAFPTARIFCMNILPRSSANAASLAPYRAAIASAVSATGDGRISVIDVTGWGLDGPANTDYTTNYLDGLHLNSAGHGLVASKLANFLLPASGGMGMGMYIGIGP